MFQPYRQLFTVPQLPALLTWSLLSRLHIAGTALALTFLVAGWTGSYATAGLVTAALTVGQGIAGPLGGRIADRGSVPRLLVVTGVLYGAGLMALAALPASAWPVAPAVALLTGLAMPPTTPVSRATWQRIAHGTAREAVYSAETTLQELLFVVGPLLAASAVAFLDARAAVGLCAASAVLGAVGFAAAIRRAGPAIGATHSGPRPRQRSSVLATAGMPAAFAMVLCLVGGLSSVDIVLVAWARGQGKPGLAGVLGAVWAIGSLAGGLVAGGRTRPPRLGMRMAMLAVGLAALVPVLPPVLTPSSPWLIGAVLAVGGVAIAPALATGNSRIGALAPEDRKTEAFGWIATATTMGPALASPAAGWLLDHVGPAASVASAAGAAAVAAAFALCLPRVTVPTGTVLVMTDISIHGEDVVTCTQPS